MRRKSFFSVSSAMRIALEFKTFDSTNSPKIICQTRKSKLRLILYKAFGSANEPLKRNERITFGFTCCPSFPRVNKATRLLKKNKTKKGGKLLGFESVPHLVDSEVQLCVDSEPIH